MHLGRQLPLERLTLLDQLIAHYPETSKAIVFLDRSEYMKSDSCTRKIAFKPALDPAITAPDVQASRYLVSGDAGDASCRRKTSVGFFFVCSVSG